MTASWWFSTLFLHVKAGFELESKSRFAKKCREFQGEEEAPPFSKTRQVVEGNALLFVYKVTMWQATVLSFKLAGQSLAETIANNLFQFTEDCKSQFLVTLNVRLGVTFRLNVLLNLDLQKQKVDMQIVKFSLQIANCNLLIWTLKGLCM